MKTTPLIAIPLLMLLAVLLPGALAAIPQGSALTVTLLRYDPVPAGPGDVIDAYFVVTNGGGDTARDVTMELVDNYPFSADNRGDAIKTLPALPGQESWVGKYKVRISQDATEGTSYLKVRTSMKDSTATKDALFPIDIKTNDPIIAIKAVGVTPADINPGTTATITVTIQNLADSRLKDVAVKISTQKVVGATTTVLPIAPLGDSLEKRLVKLDPGEEARVSYTVIIEPGAASDVYRIPITIDYSDESGNDYERSDEVGIMVNAEPDMQVYLESIEAYKENRQGDITIKFVNRGLSKLKLVTAQLGESEDFTVLTQSRETYIGNIDSDDYETATFTIKANKNAISIPVTAIYMDAFNKKYEEKAVLTATLLSEKQNGKGGTSVTAIVVVVIVIIVGFVIYRSVKKRKR